jgi:hypothetical protein
MLRFIKHHMTSIEGIELFPVISLSIFTLFFAGLLVWVMRAKKEDIDEVANYPLS